MSHEKTGLVYRVSAKLEMLFLIVLDNRVPSRG